MAWRWQPEMGKTDVGDMERRCQRERDGPPPQSWQWEREGEGDISATRKTTHSSFNHNLITILSGFQPFIQSQNRHSHFPCTVMTKIHREMIHVCKTRTCMFRCNLVSAWKLVHTNSFDTTIPPLPHPSSYEQSLSVMDTADNDPTPFFSPSSRSLWSSSWSICQAGGGHIPVITHRPRWARDKVSLCSWLIAFVSLTLLRLHNMKQQTSMHVNLQPFK